MNTCCVQLTLVSVLSWTRQLDGETHSLALHIGTVSGFCLHLILLASCTFRTGFIVIVIVVEIFLTYQDVINTKTAVMMTNR